MIARVLVAGIGSIFFGDEVFGPAVLHRLAHETLAGVRFEDFGNRGMHLAHELLAGYEAAIVVDAVSRGGPPGTLYIIEPGARVDATRPDARRLDVAGILDRIDVLVGTPPPITIVGCEPASVEEGAEMTDVVADAVEAAVPLVLRVARELLEIGKQARSEVRSIL